MITCLLLRFIENPARFFVILPFTSGILLSHERLLPDKKQIETRSGFTRLTQGKVERATRAADCTQDCFAANYWHCDRFARWRGKIDIQPLRNEPGVGLLLDPGIQNEPRPKQS